MNNSGKPWGLSGPQPIKRTPRAQPVPASEDPAMAEQAKRLLDHEVEQAFGRSPRASKNNRITSEMMLSLKVSYLEQKMEEKRRQEGLWKLLRLINKMGEDSSDGVENALVAAREELTEEKSRIEDEKRRLASCE